MNHDLYVLTLHVGLEPMISRLAPSLFRDISALRNIVTSAGAYSPSLFLRSVLFKVYAPAEVTMFLSADISRNRLGASLLISGQNQRVNYFNQHPLRARLNVRVSKIKVGLSENHGSILQYLKGLFHPAFVVRTISWLVSLCCRHFHVNGQVKMIQIWMNFFFQPSPVPAVSYGVCLGLLPQGN